MQVFDLLLPVSLCVAISPEYMSDILLFLFIFAFEALA